MKDPKNDPKNFYPRYATDNCANCNDIYYTKWGRVRQTNYDLFLPDNTIIAACRNEKGFYPYRDERGLGMSELREPNYPIIVSSGALSLGTSAGTNRSISAEFLGAAPHALTEYYGVDTGVPASGTIDFSDFYGTAAAPPGDCDPPVTNCLWTHYDISGCSTGSGISSICTTSAAAEQQCLKVIRACSGTKAVCDNVTACIKALTSNGISQNYLWVDDFKSFMTCTDNAFWGVSSGSAYPNSTLLVWQSCGGSGPYSYTIIRFNSGYGGFPYHNFNYRYPFYAGYTWMYYKPDYYSTCYHHFYIYASDCTYYGSYSRHYGQNPYFDHANDSRIVGHRICTGISYTATTDTFNVTFIDKDQACRDAYNSWYYSNASRWYQRCTSDTVNGHDWFNGHYGYYHPDNCLSRVAECFALGEYLHFKCRLTDTEWDDTLEYLANKWSATGGVGTC